MREWFAKIQFDRSLRRSILVVVGSALFFAIVSPYNAIEYLSFPARCFYWLITVSVAWITFVACRLAAIHLDRDTQNLLFTLIASLCATPLVLATIISGQQLIDYPVPAEYWFNLAVSIWVISFVLSCAHTWIHNDSVLNQSSSETEPSIASEAFTSPWKTRLPIELRDSEIYALCADDHYVHVHTQKGSSMQLLKLKDAIAMMGNVAGTQVHRSWWVANSAIKSIRSRGVKTYIVLINDTDVPVSRNGLKRIKQQNLV